MILYLSTWKAHGLGEDEHNFVSKEHPFAMLRTRRKIWATSDYVLLWFHEIDAHTFFGYYLWCVEQNGGKLGVWPYNVEMEERYDGEESG